MPVFSGRLCAGRLSISPHLFKKTRILVDTDLFICRILFNTGASQGWLVLSPPILLLWWIFSPTRKGRAFFCPNSGGAGRCGPVIAQAGGPQWLLAPAGPAYACRTPLPPQLHFPAMKRILLVGNIVLDLVHTLSHFPAEDEELRAQGRRAQLGGNAANSALRLARAGYAVSLNTLLADDAEGRWLASLLDQAGIGATGRVVASGATPMSVILATPGGARTIVHYRDLRELAPHEFAFDAALAADWVHLEGRNVDALAQLLARLRAVGYAGRISLEAEKPRVGLEALFPQVDMLMCARPYAESCGFSEPGMFLQALAFAGFATCTWGAAGAWARVDGVTRHRPAETVAVQGGVGAGDAFNAGLIAAQVDGAGVDEALAQASRWAAASLRGA